MNLKNQNISVSFKFFNYDLKKSSFECWNICHFSVHKIEKSKFLAWIHMKYFHMDIFMITGISIIWKYWSQTTTFFLYFSASRGTVLASCKIDHPKLNWRLPLMGNWQEEYRRSNPSVSRFFHAPCAKQERINLNLIVPSRRRELW